MEREKLPVEAFPPWALLQNITFGDVALRDVPDKGMGLVATTNLSSDADKPISVLQIPADVVLSGEAVEEYAKVDQNFKALLETAGRQTPRLDIMIYLFIHTVQGIAGALSGASRRGVSTPWTEYVKFLPDDVPVPTLWSDQEKALLTGTSLEDSLRAKMSALESEFDEFQSKSSELLFWNEVLWGSSKGSLQLWILADAWYRSRCLELPSLGTSMVPALDMVNHSTKPTAYYDETNNGVELLVRADSRVAGGEEVCISYGSAKPAAEMLFSYGFIDTSSVVREMSLTLQAMEDDPLAMAKHRIFDGPPVVKLAISDSGELEWSSPFAFLVCLNEEDGLEFRLLQESNSGRQLRMFWHDEDITDRVGDLQTLIQDHDLYPIFKLRVSAVLYDRITTQGAALMDQQEATPDVEVRPSCAIALELLRGIETEILIKAAEALQSEQDTLMQDERVVAYLGLREAPDSEQGEREPAPGVAVEEDDFS